MSKSIAALLVSAVFVCASAARADVPIRVVAGYGRNQTAIKLWQAAENDLQVGNVEGAHQNVDAALRSDPTLYPAFYTRAKVFLRLGKNEAALQDCTEALRQDRTFVEAALLRATANAYLHRYNESLKEIEHVIAIRPRSDGLARAFCDRAWLRATCPDASFRNGKQAISDATRACKILEWKDENTIDTLAAAYAEAGDFDSAIRYEGQALATKGVSPEHAKTMQKHLQMFKEHRPIRSGG